LNFQGPKSSVKMNFIVRDNKRGHLLTLLLLFLYPFVTSSCYLPYLWLTLSLPKVLPFRYPKYYLLVTYPLPFAYPRGKE
jgi:hypothetical protein